jgi:excisionase family DNA binding protein
MEDSTSDVKSFTTQQVAEKLGVSAATVQDLLRSGELIGYKLKRQWRVLDSDLRAFLDARRRRS